MLLDYKLLNGNGSELSHEELRKFWEFYNMMSGSMYSRFIFRGESNMNLMHQFNVDTSTPNLLSKCLFMTGEKCRICWADNEGMDPDDVTTCNFLNICRSLVRYIDEGLMSGGNRAGRIRRFCEREDQFYNGIKDEANLVEAYEKLEYEDKRKVNLYYLAVAHTINDKEYRDTSGYVSTTINERIAGRFAHDACIYGWVPKNLRRRKNRRKTIDLVDTNDMSAIMSTGLPYCKIAVFPNQEEIAIRCGLLPHFIIGYAVETDFYVNPAIFDAIDNINALETFKEMSSYKKRIQLNGLNINQENFVEFCQRTNFKKFFTFDGEGYEMHRL